MAHQHKGLLPFVISALNNCSHLLVIRCSYEGIRMCGTGNPAYWWFFYSPFLFYHFFPVFLFLLVHRLNEIFSALCSWWKIQLHRCSCQATYMSVAAAFMHIVQAAGVVGTFQAESCIRHAEERRLRFILPTQLCGLFTSWFDVVRFGGGSIAPAN